MMKHSLNLLTLKDLIMLQVFLQYQSAEDRTSLSKALYLALPLQLQVLMKNDVLDFDLVQKYIKQVRSEPMNFIFFNTLRNSG